MVWAAVLVERFVVFVVLELVADRTSTTALLW